MRPHGEMEVMYFLQAPLCGGLRASHEAQAASFPSLLLNQTHLVGKVATARSPPPCAVTVFLFAVNSHFMGRCFETT